jgi:uncharacterized protein YjdB
VPFSILPNTHTVLYIRNGGSDWKTKVANNDTSNTNLHAWAGIDKQWFDLNYGEVNEVALQFRFFAAYVTKFYNITAASCAVVSAYGNIGTYSFTLNVGTNYTGTFNGQVQSWDYTLPQDVVVNRNSLQPSSNSLGAFTFTSNNIAVASIVGNQVTVLSAGTARIMAQQAAAGNYTASLTIFHDFVVNKIAPTFVGTFTVPAKDFNSGAFTLTPPSSNSLGAFTFTSSNTSVATVGSTTGVVTIVGGGTAVITVTQAATTNYTSKSIGADFVVNPIAPTFGSFSIGSRDFGTAPFTLTPPTSSNSLGAFTFTSSKPEVATVVSTTGVVTIVGAGTTLITVTQAATTNYTSKSIGADFVVNKIAPTLTNFTIPAKNFGSAPFILTPPSSNSLGAFTFTSSNIAVAKLNIPNPNALKFDGVNDTVALSRYPALNSTNTLTIEGWIYITSYTKNVITLNSHSGIDILADGKISIWTNFTGNGWVNVTSDSSVPLNSWTYIAVVLNDGGYNKMYINNTLVKNSVNTGSGLFIACTAISLAANAPANANFSNISISEFRIWSVARTAQQIADNYNIQIPSNSSGLVIYYKFDQGTANGTNTGLTTLTDYTSNNYHGTLRGFALSGTTSNWVSGPILPLVCIILGVGTTIITATQAAAGNYTASLPVTADFVVN